MTAPASEHSAHDPSPAAVPLLPPAHPLPPRVRTWWRIHALGWPGAAVVVLLVLAALITPVSSWLVLAAAVVAVVGLAVGLALPAYWYRVHRWEITDEAVYTRSGFLWQEWRATGSSAGRCASRGPSGGRGWPRSG